MGRLPVFYPDTKKNAPIGAYSRSKDHMDATEKRIMDQVDSQRDDLIEFYRELVRCESLTGHELGVANALVDGLAKRGYTDVEIVGPAPDRPNVLGYLRGVEEGPTYYFNGHLDVITPGDVSEWEHAPFSADYEDGKIYGRGTVDMKSGTFSSFFAGLILNQLGIPLRGKVVFTGVCDELKSGNDGVLWLLKEGYIKKERDDDFGINCEPTDMTEMCMSTKGIYRAKFTVQGKGAYNARPYLGINAIDKAADLIKAINDYDKRIKVRTHPLLAPPTVCVAMIEGGEATNTVPDRCVLTVTRRMLPSETLEQVKAEYDEILADLKAKDPEFSCTYEQCTNFRPPVDNPMDSLIVRVIRKALKTVTGREMIQNGSEGGTDASHVVYQTGMTMPNLGPGDYRLLGTNEEYIKADDFIDIIKIYALSIYYALGLDYEAG